MRPWFVGWLVLHAGPTAADQNRPIHKIDVLHVLKSADSTVKSVSELLPSIDGHYIPALYVTGGRDCLTRTIDGEKEENCSSTTTPHVALLKRNVNGALTIERSLALPIQAAPWDTPEGTAWGIHIVKDYDLDGKPELMLTYSYHGPMVWAIGNIAYKHWCIINLDQLTLAAHVIVYERPQATVTAEIESSWKLVPVLGETPRIVVHRSEGTYDDAKGGRLYRKSVLTYRYDAPTDRWVPIP